MHERPWLSSIHSSAVDAELIQLLMTVRRAEGNAVARVWVSMILISLREHLRVGLLSHMRTPCLTL